jgi:hypothetical protein
MAGFEKQLESIKSKADLHKWVDELPDGVVGIILVRNPAERHDPPDGCGEEHESYSYREIGEITLESTLYMIRSYEHWIFGDMRD